MANQIQVLASRLALFGLALLPWLVCMLAFALRPLPDVTSVPEAALWLALATFLILGMLLLYERLALKVGMFCVGTHHEAMAFRPEAILSPVAGSPGTTLSEREQIVQVRIHLQSAMNEEFSNIVQRVGWAFTGQAFLMGAFATLLTSATVDRSLAVPALLLVSVLGLLVSCAVLVGVNLGHAYISLLRTARDDAERYLQANYGLPQTGLDHDSPLLRLGHSTSRYLPALAYAFWVALCLHVALPRLMNPHASSPPSVAARVWSLHAEASPAFPVSRDLWDTLATSRPEACTGPGSAWAQGFVAQWQRRPGPLASDVVLLTASADRQPLGNKLQAAMENSLSLARGRAQTALAMLQACKRTMPEVDRLGPHRVMINTLAPRPGPVATRVQGQPTCGNDCDEDRTVQLWYEAGAIVSGPARP